MDRLHLFIGLLLCFGITLISPIVVQAASAGSHPKHFSQTVEPIATYHQPYSPLPGIEIAEEIQEKTVLIIVSLGPSDNEDYFAGWERTEAFRDIIQSHWQVRVEIVDYADYVPGMASSYEVIFFIEEYDIEAPADFYDELNSLTEKKVIWTGFNSGYLVTNLLDNSEATVSGMLNPETVTYKDVDFSATQMKWLDSFGIDKITDRMKVLAWIADEDNNQHPLIVLVDDRQLVLPFEIPYTYSVNDYTLVFLDTLHYVLGHHQPKRQALLRLEDVDTQTHANTKALNRAYDLLKDEAIPFQIALIARYINPPQNQVVTLGEKDKFNKLIQKMVGEGLGVLVQHGFTHQHGNSISGLGFEFWDEQADAPIEEDSSVYAFSRIEQAQNIMSKNGFPVPDIWETPHYVLSELDDEVVSRYYPIRYGDLQNIGSLPFTATINNTVYLPENLGYVDEGWEDVEAIVDNMRRLSVFEDPTASLFWHPWRDISELEHLLSVIQTYGYQFVSAYDLLEADPYAGRYAYEPYINDYELIWKQKVTDVWIAICFTMFTLGAVMYVHNVYRIKKYVKHLKRQVPTIKELQLQANELGKDLPRIAILVPARNESRVIANTVKRLSKLEYPRELLTIIVIVDERELDDGVEKLTKSVVKNLQKRLNRQSPGLVSCWQVPKWYSGIFGSNNKSYARSTKGRALNYALTQLQGSGLCKTIDLIGVVDADGRLATKVLEEVAWLNLTQDSRLMQGPVYQISNFDKVSITGIAAGLELAIHHMTELPDTLIKQRQRPQFLAGTNYFIDKKLLMNLGGWNQDALVEDAELALRVYINTGIIPHWLSWPEVEQTPATISIYRKQRERWVRGHLELIPKIRQAPIPLIDKTRFLFTTYFSIFRVFIDLGLPIMGWLLMFSGVLLEVGPALTVFSIILLISSVFIWDFYGYMYRMLCRLEYVELNGYQPRLESLWQSFRLVMFMPFFIVIQAIPRLTAAIKHYSGMGTAVWYKTERTVETVTE